MDVAFTSHNITIDRSVKRPLKPFKVTMDMSRSNRPTAKGEIDETNKSIHIGFVTFPDDRKYKFWYHTDEAKIYWDNDKGKTNNVWTGNSTHGRGKSQFLFLLSLKFGRK